MGFIRRLIDSFGNSPPVPQGVVLSDRAAEAIRKVAADNGVDEKLIGVFVARLADGQFDLKLTDEPEYRENPDNFLSESKGLRIIVPRVDMAWFHDLVIDYEPEQRGFRFNGSVAAEPIATDPAGVEMSRRRFFALWPEAAKNDAAIAQFQHHLTHGDSRAAIVMSTQPLVIAAYTDELDAVALLEYPAKLAREFSLKPGQRMLTVNLHRSRGGVASDLVLGANDRGGYTNFFPVIAEFLTDDHSRIERRKAAIAEAEWARTAKLAGEAMLRANGRYRDGRPPESETPAY